jgi:hypothetical protein
MTETMANCKAFRRILIGLGWQVKWQFNYEIGQRMWTIINPDGHIVVDDFLNEDSAWQGALDAACGLPLSELEAAMEFCLLITAKIYAGYQIIIHRPLVTYFVVLDPGGLIGPTIEGEGQTLTEALATAALKATQRTVEDPHR